MPNGNPRSNEEHGWIPAQQVLAWHGWGSPVGLGLLLVCAGLFAVLLRHAISGAL